MRKSSNLIGTAIALALFTIIVACKKEKINDYSPPTANSSLAVSDAREWFEANRSIGLNLTGNIKQNTFNEFTPDWENAIISEDAKLSCCGEPGLVCKTRWFFS